MLVTNIVITSKLWSLSFILLLLLLILWPRGIDCDSDILHNFCKTWCPCFKGNMIYLTLYKGFY